MRLHVLMKLSNDNAAGLHIDRAGRSRIIGPHRHARGRQRQNAQ